MTATAGEGHGIVYIVLRLTVNVWQCHIKSLCSQCWAMTQMTGSSDYETG